MMTTLGSHSCIVTILTALFVWVVLVPSCAAADVLLWKDKKTTAVVIGGTTLIWVLFEVLDYHLLTLLSHVLIGVLAVLFVWSKAMTFIKK